MLTTHPITTDICGVDGLAYEEALQMLFPDKWWWYVEEEVLGHE